MNKGKIRALVLSTIRRVKGTPKSDFRWRRFSRGFVDAGTSNLSDVASETSSGWIMWLVLLLRSKWYQNQILCKNSSSKGFQCREDESNDDDSDKELFGESHIADSYFRGWTNTFLEVFSWCQHESELHFVSASAPLRALGERRIQVLFVRQNPALDSLVLGQVFSGRSLKIEGLENGPQVNSNCI